MLTRVVSEPRPQPALSWGRAKGFAGQPRKVTLATAPRPIHERRCEGARGESRAAMPTENLRDRDERNDDRSAWSSLMARAQEGDQGAYRQLLYEITGYLRSLAAQHHRNPADAEDTVQDILLTVHAVRHTYDPSRPFGPWLVAIAHRRIIDRLRRQGRRQARETPLEPRHETCAAPAANLYEVAEEERTLRQAIDSLPKGQRRAIRLLKLDEMSLREAAAVSGQSIGSLKVASHRAVRGLRKILGDRTLRDHDA